MSTSLKHYLTTVENALKAGNATEHTHRPALKALLESLDLHLTATNEPKRIACGAPDYIITRADLTIGYPVAGDNRVEKGYPRYAPPTDDRPGRITINKSQYFEGISPELWEFYIGGYQVLQKWLKDRQGRQLSYAEHRYSSYL
jgi:hypothetical protein